MSFSSESANKPAEPSKYATPFSTLTLPSNALPLSSFFVTTAKSQLPIESLPGLLASLNLYNAIGNKTLAFSTTAIFAYALTPFGFTNPVISPVKYKEPSFSSTPLQVTFAVLTESFDILTSTSELAGTNFKICSCDNPAGTRTTLDKSVTDSIAITSMARYTFLVTAY